MMAAQQLLQHTPFRSQTGSPSKSLQNTYDETWSAGQVFAIVASHIKRIASLALLRNSGFMLTRSFIP